MSDLRRQIQQHYEARELSGPKAEAILAAGRVAAEGGEKVVPLPRPQSTMWRVAWAVAAGFVILAGIAAWWMTNGTGSVDYALFAPRVVEFFQKDPELPKRSQNPEELRAWLLAQGAPADFQIPARLRVLKSFGCQVVDMHGRPAYLTCFWSEKKPGVDQGSLVHLLVARRRDFKDTPPSSTPQFREIGPWSFAGWSDGDVIYTMAAKAPLEKLKTFLALTPTRAPRGVLAAGRFGIGDERW